MVVYESELDHEKSCWCLLEINFEVSIAEHASRIFRSVEVTSMSDSLLRLIPYQYSYGKTSVKKTLTYSSENEARSEAFVLLI